MDYDYNNGRQDVRWNGSTYSTNNYRVENAEPTPTPPEKKPKKKRPVLRAIALILCCALVGGGAGAGGAALYFHLNPPQSNTTIIRENTNPANPVGSASPSPSQGNNGDRSMNLTELFDACADSTVVISSQVSYTTQSWYGPMTQEGVSSGSGFIISENGYIVTNYHVIDGAQKIKVTLYDGTDYDATYVGGEQANDVAVLKVDAKGLQPVVLGDSDTLQVGEQVCTIGNALGALSFSQTSGYVSGLGRSVTYSDGTVINMIQTDCTINSGNSGGPLFDSQGRVVGITSAKYSNNGGSDASIENIGFAIPINDVKNIITDIMQNGFVVRPYLGILYPATIEDRDIQVFGWPHGVYVNNVEEGSCAETAGIRRGDIITKLGDTEITSVAELTAAKNRFKPGDSTTVELYRAGETLSVTITFDKSPDPSEGTSQQPGSGSSGEQPAQNGNEGQYPGNGYGDNGYGDNGQFGGNDSYSDFYNDFFNRFFGG